MNRSIVWAIAQKDWKEVTKNKLVLTPAMIVPLIFVVLMPAIMILSIRFAPMAELTKGAGIGPMLERMPRMILELVRGMGERQTLVILAAGYMFAPLFLILPVMVASIFGADSFAGEKERKTLEALLYTPATDEELFLGKTLFCLLPAVGVTWMSFLVYAVVVNSLAWPLFGRVWFPLLPWWPLMLWVVPAIATLALAATVLISARVSTFMEAYQMGGSLVLVVLALLAGQATGFLALGVFNTLWIGALLWGVDWLLVRYAVRTFSRSELISRL